MPTRVQTEWQTVSNHCHTMPTPTEAQSQPRSAWDSPNYLFNDSPNLGFSNIPTRNCNPREEGSDITIDPTFNNKMDEMLLSSYVDVKDLWRKK